jgi:hypothetical protein
MADETLITEVDYRALIREAQDLGIHYTGDDGVELHGLVAMARAEKGRDHPVPCYGQSFDPTDRRCRICQLRNPCADLDHRPRVDVLEAKLQAIPCEACGKGMLEIELVNAETKEVRDYGCTTRGCPNSIKVQCGWESIGSEVVREIVLGSQASTGSADPDEAGGEEPPPEAPESGATDPVGESAAPVPPPKPSLRAIEGGKGKKGKAANKKAVIKKLRKQKAEHEAAPKRKIVVIKKATTAKQAAAAKKPPAAKRKAPTKKAAKKEAKKKAPEKKPTEGSHLAFHTLGVTYPSLSALVNDITSSRNWSPSRFFSHIDTKALRVGDKFSRDYNGTEVSVEVIKR